MSWFPSDDAQWAEQQTRHEELRAAPRMTTIRWLDLGMVVTIDYSQQSGEYDLHIDSAFIDSFPSRAAALEAARAEYKALTQE